MERLLYEVKKVIVGQDHLLERLIVALLAGLWRREAWVAAALATVLLIGLQTDVIGIHWIAFTVWVAEGLALGRTATAARKREPQGV